MVINFSTRPKRIQELINLIINDKEVRDIVQSIYLQDIFSFTYNVRKFAKVKGDYPDLGYDMDDFKAGTRLALEFQLVLCNFKVSKRVNAVKAYSFQLLEVYLIDKLTNSTISTLEKQCQRDNKWMVIPSHIKKTITIINSLTY